MTSGDQGVSFPGKLVKSLIAIGEFWCMSWKKITTYDCIFLGEKQACTIIETVVFLGRQNIPLLEAIETMGF